MYLSDIGAIEGTGPIDTAIITTPFKGINYLGTEIPEQSGEMGLWRDAETEGTDVRYRERDGEDGSFTKK